MVSYRFLNGVAIIWFYCIMVYKTGCYRFGVHFVVCSVVLVLVVSGEGPVVLGSGMRFQAHVIDDVPYIAQSEGFFCYYACIAMILDFYGLNTSLDEILFLDGVGYSHYYSEGDRLPVEGRYSDVDFVFSLFGVEQRRWNRAQSGGDANWNQYVDRVVENVSVDVPVITAVDPFRLSSLRDQFMVSDLVWNMMFPAGFHIIVVVGYNLSNHSICFHDSNAGFYGEDDFGRFAWMSLDDFRMAVEGSRWGEYYVSTLVSVNSSCSVVERFEEAIGRNREKLNGSFDGYAVVHGVQASEAVLSDFLEDSLSKTVRLYRWDGVGGWMNQMREFGFRVCEWVWPDQANIFAVCLNGEDNPFASIGWEKWHVADYLENTSFYMQVCRNQSVLLRVEAMEWLAAAEWYQLFLRKGLWFSRSKGTTYVLEMKACMDTIVDVEYQVIQNLDEV